MGAETKIKAAPSVGELAMLRQPFPANLISKLPKPTKAQTEAVRNDFKKGIRCKLCGSWHHPDVVHLDYVGHAALTDRLLDTDPEWSWEPVAFTEQGLPAFDQSGGLWIKLTVCGVTRLGYGHAASKPNQDPGAREKEVIGDALRNAAMRFGAALDLWHKGDLHADEGGAGQGQSQGNGQGAVSPDGPADYIPPEPMVEDRPTTNYAFPDGPARNVTDMKNMVRPLWREIKGCGDEGELIGLLEATENKALLDQVSRLENPAHRRELWEGDGKDNPGLQGLIEQMKAEFAQPNILQAG